MVIKLVRDIHVRIGCYANYLRWASWIDEPSGVEFGLKSFAWFQIERARSVSSIWNHKYDFRPKLHDTRFNYHFITSILKSPKYRTWQVQIFYCCSTELVWNEIHPFFFLGGGGESKSFGNKSCKIWHMILCLSFSCNVIGNFKQALKSDWLFCF